MGFDEHIGRSDREGTAADAYHRILQSRFEEVVSRSSALRAKIDELRFEQEELDVERGHLAALLGIAERTSPHERTVVRFPGVAGVDSVVELLGREDRPLHYREIAKLLQDSGHVLPGGADPANTLLAKYFNDPRLYRPKRGTYAIKPPGREPRSVGARQPRAAGAGQP